MEELEISAKANEDSNFYDFVRRYGEDSPSNVLKRFLDWFNAEFDTDFSLVDNKVDWHRQEHES